MKPIDIAFVKPHPPKEIMDQACPIPDPYRYNWMPMALKVMGSELVGRFGDQVRVKVYHLMDARDELRFFDDFQKAPSDVVALSEIDLLVNEVNRIAQRIKQLSSSTLTVTGGKQSSLLRTGDTSPFRGVDMAIRGDGINAMSDLVRKRLESGVFCHDIGGSIQTDEDRLIVGNNDFGERFDISQLDLVASHRLDVEDHSFESYLSVHQKFPSIVPGDIRTSTLFTGTGCPHSCNFCQSPFDYGDMSKKVFLRSQHDVAREMVWLKEAHGVNNFFSLEPSLNLTNLLRVFDVLEQEYGVAHMPISGFVHAVDVVKAYKRGILQQLVQKGVRVLSIGLDIPLDSQDDVYNKNFSYDDMIECLRICNELGILPVVTIVGDPNIDAETFKKQLDTTGRLPVAGVDVRLTIALRNTTLFKLVEDKLIHNPSTDPTYFDQQNYRYQTVQVPGEIRPEQTYDLVNAFHRDFLVTPSHVTYVLNMLRRFPDSKPFFVRQYKDYEKNSGRKHIPPEIISALTL